MSLFRFEWGKFENKSKSKEMGRPFYEPCIMCRFVKQGGDIVIRADVSAFKETYLTIRNPGDKEHVEQVKTLTDALKDFKERGEKQVDGTPVTEWPMLNVAESENLRVAGIETIEQLSKMSDEELKLTMIPRELREKAVAWLEHASNEGVAAAKTAQLVERVKELEDALKERDATVKRLEAALDTLKQPEQKQAKAGK